MTGRSARVQARIGALSVVVGPALMSLGDLFHPPENWDAATQIAILADDAARWYAAHLLLFVGLLLFIPGVLALTKLGAGRRPGTAYAARILMLISAGPWAAVLLFETLLGRFLSNGADPATAVLLLETFQAPAVFAAVLPGVLAFFVGTACFVWSLTPLAPGFRWPAMLFALGAALILAEIVLAQVLLSQIGNVLILVAGAGFAPRIIGREAAVAV